MDLKPDPNPQAAKRYLYAKLYGASDETAMRSAGGYPVDNPVDRLVD